MTLIDSRQFLESEQFQFYIAPYAFSPGEAIAAHSHNFFELVYVAEGQGEHYYRGEHYRISEGDIFVIEPGEEHAYNSVESRPPIVYNILFQPELLQRELQMLADVTSFVDFFYMEPFLRQTVQFQAHLRLQPSEQLEIESLLERIILDFKKKKLGYQILTKTRLIELFVFLSRCYQDYQRTPFAILSSDEKIIHYISEFIRAHYAQPLTLLQVSEMCRMSLAGFSAKFKQYMGRTFIEFRNEIRIRMARQLLLQSDKKIMEIAFEVGCDDLSFFNKMFKQAVGMSPSQYRKSAKT